MPRTVKACSGKVIAFASSNTFRRFDVILRTVFEMYSYGMRSTADEAEENLKPCTSVKLVDSFSSQIKWNQKIDFAIIQVVVPLLIAH